MTVAQLIEELNKVEDKEKEVKFIDLFESTSLVPVFIDVDNAYFNNHLDAFLIV